MDRVQTVFAIAVIGLVLGLRDPAPKATDLAVLTSQVPAPAPAASPVTKLRPGSAASVIAGAIGLTDDATLDDVTARARATFGAATVLIATLPHPKASFLDWAFDSHLDAIRRGFERTGATLVRHALPWTPQWKPDSRAAEIGVLFFRASSASLPTMRIVLLVPEISTGGIDRLAFERALEERAEILRLVPPPRDARDEVAILGPVFSGSTSSLREALEASARAVDGAGTPRSLVGTVPVRIVSGAATSPRNKAAFDAATAPRIDFATTLHTDETLLETLRTRVLPRLGLLPSEVAMLEESTTEYGRAFAPSPGEPKSSAGSSGTPAAPTSGGTTPQFVRIPFPMSIATLRGASKKEELEAAAPASPTTVGLARARVSLSMSETSGRRESIAPASELTPASIDLMLEELGRSLAMRGIRGVLLVATDVRDKLYLAKELKKRLPDLQIFTTESNVLYVRPEFNPWMRGAVVVSTYPLLLRDPAWLPQSEDRYEVAFANEGAQGTYNATLWLLGQPRAMADYRFPISGARPAGANEGPPVWATVVGAGSMLPLAAFHASDVRTAPPEPGVVRASGQDAGAPAERTPIPRATSPSTERSDDRGRHFLAVAGTSLLAIVLLVVVAVDRMRRRKPVDGELPPLADAQAAQHSDWAARHRDLQRVALSLHHEIYAALLYVALIGMLAPNVTLMLVRGGFVDDLLPARVLGVVALVAGGAATGARVVEIARQLRLHGAGGLSHLRAAGWPNAGVRFQWCLELALRLGVALAGVAHLAVTLAFSWQLARASQAEGAAGSFSFFFHRATAIDQGVSPLVPLMLIGAILASWCAWHLRRIRLLAEPAPAQLYLDRGARQDAATRGRVSRVWPALFLASPNAFGIVPLACIAISALWLYVQFSPSLEGVVLAPVGGHFQPFDLVLRLGVLGALAASCWAVYRLVVVWFEFRATLRAHRSLFRALAFERVRTKYAFATKPSLWPSSNVADMRLVVVDRWEELARTAAGAAGSGSSTAARARTLAAERARDGAPSRRVVEALRDLIDDFVAGGARVPSTEPASAAASASRAALVHEVLCLEVMLFVEWLYTHVRQLCFFLLASIVLTTLLISSYPFAPHDLVQIVSWIVFAGVTGVLVWLIASMNRDPALSHVGGTEEGRITWDRTLLVNVALYVIVPVITLLGSSSPGLRDSFLSWIKPMLQGAGA